MTIIPRQTFILMILLCFSLFVSCSKKGSSSNSSIVSEPKIKLHEIGMEVKRDQLSPNQKQLINQIDGKKTVDQDLLLEIILEIHKEEFLKSGFQTSEINPPLMGYFDPLLDSISQDTGPHGFKTGYEKNILDLHSGQPMKYNKTHTSVFSPVFANRMQCYSGTMFFSLLYRRFKKSDYFDSNPVFIYEDGHVLPGYMTKVDNQWHLFGVETTLGGAAKKIYGPTSGLKGVRVVDAHLALGIEALKNHITNKASVLKTALKRTAELYDIPLEQIETSLSNVSISLDGTLGSGTTVSDTNSYLNSSLFGFGDSSQVPDGDQDRESVDEFTAKPGSSGSRILSDPGNWRNQLSANPVTTTGNLPGNQNQVNTTIVTESFQHPFSDSDEWVFIMDSNIFYLKGPQIQSIKQGLKHLFNPDVPIFRIMEIQRSLWWTEENYEDLTGGFSEADLENNTAANSLKSKLSWLRQESELLLANKDSLQFWESLTKLKDLFSIVYRLHYDDQLLTDKELQSESWDIQVISQHTCVDRHQLELPYKERKWRFWNFDPTLEKLDSHSTVELECKLFDDFSSSPYKLTKYGFVSGFSQRKGLKTIEFGGILSGASAFGKIELSQELSATDEPEKKVDLIFSEGR